MSARARSTALVAVLLVALSTASTLPPASADAKAAPAWTAPKRVPGTAGLFNPQASTAPDGTDLVLWGVAAGGLENEIHAKVRRPGRDRWVNVPVRLHGDFLGINDIQPTPSGDFWAVYSISAGGYVSYLVKLDSRTHRWSKPLRLFKDQADNYHGFPQLAMTGDGTLVVATYAPPIAGGATRRVAVGLRPPGGGWHNRFISPPGKSAGVPDLAVNLSGDMVISFIQGSLLAEMTVRAATKAHGSATWKVGTLSPAGDSQRVHSTISANGTAAVAWSATSTSFDAVRMATRNVRRPLAPWVGQDIVTATPVSTDAYAVVDAHGNATAVWAQYNAGLSSVWTRYLHGSTLGPAVQVSRMSENDVLAAARALPSGRVAVLYQRFGPAAHSLGLDYLTVNKGVAGQRAPLVGDETTDGDVNGSWLNVDAASQATVVYNRGTNPDVDFAWLTNAQARPSVMTTPWSGTVVRRALLAGHLQPGRSLDCSTGFWVETSSVSYHWTRDGHRIPGATARRYPVVDRDSGHRIACQATAGNSSAQKLVLTSPGRRVA